MAIDRKRRLAEIQRENLMIAKQVDMAITEAWLQMQRVDDLLERIGAPRAARASDSRE